MKILIREAQPEDINSIREIFNEVISKTTAIYSNHLMTQPEIEEWFKVKTEKSWPVFVAEIDGEVAGFTTYGPFRGRDAYSTTVELAVHVSERYRGKGVGSLLLKSLIERAEGGNFHVMIAAIDATNQGSIRLHKRFGFEICGDIKQVARKFDRWLDLILMQKIL